MDERYYFSMRTVDRGTTYTNTWGWATKPIETRDGLLIITRVDGSACIVAICNLEYLSTFPKGDDRIPEKHR